MVSSVPALGLLLWGTSHVRWLVDFVAWCRRSTASLYGADGLDNTRLLKPRRGPTALLCGLQKALCPLSE